MPTSKLLRHHTARKAHGASQRARSRRAGAGAGGELPPGWRVGREQRLATHRKWHAPRRGHQSAAGQPVSGPLRPPNGRRGLGTGALRRRLRHPVPQPGPRASRAGPGASLGEGSGTDLASREDPHRQRQRARRVRLPWVSLRAGHEMAPLQEPEEAERKDQGQDLTIRRAEAEGNRGGRESNIAGLVWLLPAQQSEHVWPCGWLRAKTTAQSAAMAAGWTGQRDRSGPSTLAQSMVCPPWAAVLGSRTRVDAYNRTTTNPLTGEPDAGDPPVRFGGRGKVNPLSLPLSALPAVCSQLAINLDYCSAETQRFAEERRERRKKKLCSSAFLRALCVSALKLVRSEERRVGKECRSR